MPGLHNERCLPCRHVIDHDDVRRVSKLLTDLPDTHGDVLREADIDPKEYGLLLRAAVESLRGTASATTEHKQRFSDAVLQHMQDTGAIEGFSFIGTRGRQDYQVTLSDGWQVSIEAKGCPDGNNMTIYERPSWAEEFVIWSQCPHSLRHEPGTGIWKGLATRVLPHVVATGQQVDAVVFYDGRCGSDRRRCGKPLGVYGDLRAQATEIPGQDGRQWMPPPCIFMLSRTVPHVPSNLEPPLHTPQTCRFPVAMLDAFGVSPGEAPEHLHWAQTELSVRDTTTYVRVTVGPRVDSPEPLVQGRWKPLRRE